MNFKNYDLKREMIKYKRVEECIKDILEKSKINIDLEKIFKDNSINYSMEK